jgi:hypothetical protein
MTDVRMHNDLVNLSEDFSVPGLVPSPIIVPGLVPSILDPPTPSSSSPPRRGRRRNRSRSRIPDGRGRGRSPVAIYSLMRGHIPDSRNRSRSRTPDGRERGRSPVVIRRIHIPDSRERGSVEELYWTDSRNRSRSRTPDSRERSRRRVAYRSRLDRTRDRRVRGGSQDRSSASRESLFQTDTAPTLAPESPATPPVRYGIPIVPRDGSTYKVVGLWFHNHDKYPMPVISQQRGLPEDQWERFVLVSVLRLVSSMLFDVDLSCRKYVLLGTGRRRS